MNRSLSVLLFSLAVCCITPSPTAAQEQSQPPANLSLQIFYKQNSTTQYLPVEPAGTLWDTHFRRTASWREPQGALPIKAVVISHSRDGEQAVVRVLLGRGEKFYDTTELIAEHRARLGESVTVGELAGFGIEPFTFKVVRQEKVALPEVGVTNLTRSIEVVSAEVTDDRAVAIRLVLRNHSAKKVAGLGLHSLGESGEGGVIAWPLGREGKSLIEPGGEYKYALRFDGAGKEVAGGFVPATPRAVKVASVLFTDGSYEGEASSAARNAAILAGDRVQLARVIALIERALASPDTRTPEAVARFKTEANGLSREADPSVVEALAASYPGLEEEERGQIKDMVEVAMHWVRQDVLKRLSAVEQQAASGPNDKPFREWLVSQQTYYETWLRSLTN